MAQPCARAPGLDSRSRAGAVGRARLVEHPHVGLAREPPLAGPTDAGAVHGAWLVATWISPSCSCAALDFETAPCTLGHHFPRSRDLLGGTARRWRSGRGPAMGDAHRLSLGGARDTKRPGGDGLLASAQPGEGRVHSRRLEYTCTAFSAAQWPPGAWQTEGDRGVWRHGRRHRRQRG